jgi:hypothetical protein
MSKLLGPKLTMQSQFSHSRPSQHVSLPQQNRRTYVCRRCGETFVHYAGVKTFPGGTGLCKEHNPNA